jgi:hypothetical protein
MYIENQFCILPSSVILLSTLYWKILKGNWIRLHKNAYIAIYEKKKEKKTLGHFENFIIDSVLIRYTNKIKISLLFLLNCTF